MTKQGNLCATLSHHTSAGQANARVPARYRHCFSIKLHHVSLYLHRDFPNGVLVGVKIVGFCLLDKHSPS